MSPKIAYLKMYTHIMKLSQTIVEHMNAVAARGSSTDQKRNPLKLLNSFILSYVHIILKHIVLFIHRITADIPFQINVLCMCCEDECCVG